jgi:hypothetical protein
MVQVQPMGEGRTKVKMKNAPSMSPYREGHRYAIRGRVEIALHLRCGQRGLSSNHSRAVPADHLYFP